MTYTFLIITLIIAIIEWIAVAKRWRKVEYITKPAVMVALLLWVVEIGGFNGLLLPFILGLIFSLAGDIFLILPKEQFIAGLLSFLLAHLAYLMGFNRPVPAFNLVTLILAVAIGLAGWQVYRRIAAGLEKSGKEKLKIPVLIYSLVISLMLLSALMTLARPDWQAGAALAAALGAMLFFISDLALAWNKFVAPLPGGRVVTMSTYHVGQMLILLGAAWQFLIKGSV